MGFLDKLRASMARFMSGRYGADQLSMAMVIAALVVSILGTFTGARAVAMVLSDALLIKGKLERHAVLAALLAALAQVLDRFASTGFAGRLPL